MKSQSDKWKVTFPSTVNVPFILLCLYIASTSLAYTPWISESVCTISLYGFVLVTFVNAIMNRKLVISPYTKWYLLFIGVCILFSLISPQITSSINSTINLIKILLLIYCFQVIVNTEERIYYTLVVFSISTVLLFAYLAYAGLLTDKITGRLGQELTGNANTFASIIMIGAIASVFCYFFNRTKVKRLLFFSFFLTQEYSIILSGGRKFFVIPIIIFAFVFLMSSNAKKNRMISRMVWIIIALLGVWYLVSNIPVFYNSIGVRFEGLFSLFSGKGTIDYSTIERMKMIQTAFSGWLDSPIWGHGTDSFKILSGFGGYAHNNYLELLFDLGMTGFIVYYSFIVKNVIGLMRKEGKNTSILFWLFVGVGLLLFDLGAVSYNTPHIQMMIAIMAFYNSYAFV